MLPISAITWDSNQEIFMLFADGRPIGRYDPEKHVLMQYTGLTDDDETEICEGAVVRAEVKHMYTSHSYICQVVFTDGFCFMLKVIKHGEPEKFKPGHVPKVKGEYFHLGIADMKVIGDIYRNPELLQEV